MTLGKLRSLPIRIRKIILWSIVIILGLGLLVWWIKNSQQRLRTFQGEKFIEELGLPEIEIPKIEMPELEEVFEKIEETTRETE